MEIAILIIALVVGVLLYGAMNGSFKFKKRPVDHKVRPMVHKLDKHQITDRWEAIERSAQGGEHGLKSAINDADKLLDQVLKQQGFRGETMALRLQKVEDRFTDKESIWRAHKLRNAIAHEIHFDIVMSQGRNALEDIKRGLKDLGAL